MMQFSGFQLSNWAREFRKNFTLIELSGSLGDLGTLLPILISLSVTNQISLSASLVFGGIWNIANGLLFNIPICVQPMKAIAASALASKLTIEEIMSAGMFVSTCVLFLGITRTITLVSKFTPTPVIKGIQVGAGLQLINKAVKLVVNSKAVWFGPTWVWSNNYEIALFAFIFVFIFFNRATVPTALLLFLIGLIFSIIVMVQNSVPGPRFEFFNPRIIVPTPKDFQTGLLSAGLGQLPLTLLNSVVALSALAHDLFPDTPCSLSHISVSVGVMNLIGCWFGSMPYCHGSGGLAGQYRFGARSGVSVIVLGFFKLLIGLLVGDSLSSTLSNLPSTILGVMLFVCGVELARAGRNYSTSTSSPTHQSQDFTILVVTTGLLVGYSSDAIGFLGGMAVAYLFRLVDYIESRRATTTTPVEDLPSEV